MDGNVVLKYCVLLDEFVKIRVFTDSELKDLLRLAVVPNRTAYRQLVVNACIMDLAAVLHDGGGARETSSPAAPAPAPSRDKVEEAEREAIIEALRACEGNQTRVARRLGISRRTLVYRIDKYRLGDVAYDLRRKRSGAP